MPNIKVSLLLLILNSIYVIIFLKHGNFWSTQLHEFDVSED